MSASALIQDVAPSSPVRCACDTVATVYLICDARFFRAPACDHCASAYLATFGPAGVSLDRVAGARIVIAIDGVDLIAFARECLDGVTGDCDLTKMTTVPGAAQEIVTALSARLRRALSPSEMLGVIEAARTEVVRRYHEKREGLLEIQRALHAPFGSGLRQRAG